MRTVGPVSEALTFMFPVDMIGAILLRSAHREPVERYRTRTGGNPP